MKNRHEEMIKILDMVESCERYIAERKHRLTLPDNSFQYLFISRSEIEAEIRFKESVRARLLNYYAKKLFQLASDTYDQIQSEKIPINN